MVLFNANDKTWSNKDHKMAFITEDTNGRDDFLLAPCSPEIFHILYNHQGYHPSCFENLSDSLKPFGIHSHEIPTASNVFMNVQFSASDKLKVEPPTSKVGDYLTIQAVLALIVALTACSAEDSNNGSFKPIHFEVY